MTYGYSASSQTLRLLASAALVIGCFAAIATPVSAQEIWNWDMVIRGTGGAVSPTPSTDVWIPPTSNQTPIIDPFFAPIDAVENPITSELLISDSYNHRVLRFDSVTGAYKGEVGLPGTFSFPYGLAVDAAGNIMVTDWGLSKVMAFDQGGVALADMKWGFAWDIAPPDIPNYVPGFSQPWSVNFTPGSAIGDGNPLSRIIVIDTGHNRVLMFGTDGTFISTFGTYGSNSAGDPVHGQFDTPVDMAFRPVSGIDPTTGAAYAYPYQLYIADFFNNRVQVLTPNGTWLGELTGLLNPAGVAVDANGRVLIADTQHHRIAVYTPYPNFVPVNVQIGFPSLGTETFPIVCDPRNPAFALLQSGVKDANQCAPGALQFPTNIGLDSTGRLIVLDSGNGRIERFNHPPMTVTAAAANDTVTSGNPITLTVVAAAASGSFTNVSATVTAACQDQAGATVNCNTVLNGATAVSPASGTVAPGAPLTFTVTYNTLTGVADKAVRFTATISDTSTPPVTATSLPSDPIVVGFTGVNLASTAVFTPTVPSTGWWINSLPSITITATGTPTYNVIEWALSGDKDNPPAPGGLQSCTGAGQCVVTLTGETSAYLWYRARNNLQTEAWHGPVPVNVELTKATISVVSQLPTPCATCSGWVNTDGVTTYAVSNSISGIASITPTPAVVNGVTIFQLSAAGEGSAVATPTLTVVDKAGLSDTATYTFKIDKTKPTISATTTRTAATNGIWNHTPVTVTFTATDPKPAGVDLQSGFPLSLSGSATPVNGDPNGKFSTTVTTENTSATVPQSVVAGPGTFVDLAGNLATNTVTVGNINIDMTAPIITPSFNRTATNGWFNAATAYPVTLTFTATDALSGMTGPTTQTVSIANTAANQGTHAFASSTAFADVAGNIAPNLSVPVSVDTALPLVASALVGPIVGSLPLVPNVLGFFDLTGLGSGVGVTVNLTAADATPGSGVQSVCYDLTTAAPATPTCAPATLNGTVYTLTVLNTTTVARAWVIDNAGNQSAFQSFSVKIARSTPIAVGNNVSMLENGTLTNTLTSTGAAVGATLTYTISTQPAHGTVTVTAATGAFTYKPTTNYSGSDSFTFTVSDGAGISTPATINISIGAVNQPPVATAGSATTLEDVPVTIAVIPGLVTDVDTPIAQLSIVIATQPTKGTAVASGGSIIYTPNPGLNGIDTFTYRAYDGALFSTATPAITVTITPVNDAPTFVKGPDVVSNEDDGAKTILNWATGILAGPPDEVASQTLNFIVTNTNNALFSAQPAVSKIGTLTYTSAANVSGTATVSVALHDNGGVANGGHDTSAAQTFVITINPVNDAPTFTPGPSQTVAVNSGARSVAWATAISAGPNETTQGVNFIVSNSNNALFSAQPAISQTGTLTFTPATGASGTAAVTVQLHDDGGVANGGVDTSAPVTFTITVSAANRPPVAVNDSATTTVRTPILIDVLANDSDPDGDPLTITSVTARSSGGTALIVGNQIKFTPSPRLTRGNSDTFSYTISDGHGGTATATVTVTIVNSPPVANPDSVSTLKGEPVKINVLANDTDPDKDKLTLTAVTAPAHGTATITSGAVKYTPVSGYEGTDTFTYTVSDGKGGTAIGTVTVTIKRHFDGDGCSEDQRGHGHHDDDDRDTDHDRDTRRGGRLRGW